MIFIILVQADVIKAKSCSQQAVQAAIDTAQDGDTVLVPVGAATWTTPAIFRRTVTWLLPRQLPAAMVTAALMPGPVAEVALSLQWLPSPAKSTLRFRPAFKIRALRVLLPKDILHVLFAIEDRRLAGEFFKNMVERCFGIKPRLKSQGQDSLVLPGRVLEPRFDFFYPVMINKIVERLACFFIDDLGQVILGNG